MKFMLAMIFCTAVYQQCQEPHAMPGSYDNWYNCMLAGYKESLKKLQEIGIKDVNEHEIYLRFICKGYKEPKVDT